MATRAMPMRTDGSLHDSVISELKWDPSIPTANDIALRVKDGVVTLTGFVHTYWEKDAAERTARRVYGVKGLANDIEVKLTSTRTDPEIAQDAVRQLESHVSLPTGTIKPTVKGGWVTLEGTVDWYYQKSLAEYEVKKLKGVLGVTNSIEIKPTVTSSEIQSKIEEALKRNAQLDARGITVAVAGGKVDLYGSVQSWAERSQAEQAAWSAPGAERIENHITIF